MWLLTREPHIRNSNDPSYNTDWHAVDIYSHSYRRPVINLRVAMDVIAVYTGADTEMSTECCGMERDRCRWMEAVSGAMVARWRGRVATTVVSVSLLLAVFLLFLRNQPPSVVCPDSDSSQLPHQHQQTAQQFDDDVFRLRSEPSRRNRSERNEFQLGVVRPTDSLPTVAKTTAAAAAATESKSRARQPFVLHRCPPSYDISDAQDEWFRTQVVQRSPPTSQVKFTDEILIVTPIRNSETHLRRYFENLCSLAYPHRLLSVVLGEDSSEDKTVQVKSSS